MGDVSDHRIRVIALQSGVDQDSSREVEAGCTVVQCDRLGAGLRVDRAERNRAVAGIVGRVGTVALDSLVPLADEFYLQYYRQSSSGPQYNV